MAANWYGDAALLAGWVILLDEVPRAKRDGTGNEVITLPVILPASVAGIAGTGSRFLVL